MPRPAADRVTGEVRRRGPATPPVRYERERPGELIHVDVKKVTRIPDGGGHRALGRGCGSARGMGSACLHVAVDDFSRVAYAELLPDERKGPARRSWEGPCGSAHAGPPAHVAHLRRKQPIGTQHLADAPDAFVWNRSAPICDVPKIGIGSQPIDDGNYLFTSEARGAFLRIEPGAERFFRKWLGSREFLHGTPRWVLYLGEATFAELKELPRCCERIEPVRQYRLTSKRPQTKKAEDRSQHFGTEVIPQSTSIVIPEVSSERRRYIPMGFIGPEAMCSNLVKLIPNADIYQFGVLQSQVHNAWMRMVAGRLKSDYNYANTIVYNNFVWPEPTDADHAEVERCAQAVLDARATYGGSTLADMYDPDNEFLYPMLAKAHRALDAAVEAAYGVDFGGDEEKIVAHLFGLYAEKTSQA